MDPAEQGDHNAQTDHHSQDRSDPLRLPPPDHPDQPPPPAPQQHAQTSSHHPRQHLPPSQQSPIHVTQQLRPHSPHLRPPLSQATTTPHHALSHRRPHHHLSPPPPYHHQHPSHQHHALQHHQPHPQHHQQQQTIPSRQQSPQAPGHHAAHHMRPDRPLFHEQSRSQFNIHVQQQQQQQQQQQHQHLAHARAAAVQQHRHRHQQPQQPHLHPLQHSHPQAQQQQQHSHQPQHQHSHPHPHQQQHQTPSPQTMDARHRIGPSQNVIMGMQQATHAIAPPAPTATPSPAPAPLGITRTGPAIVQPVDSPTTAQEAASQIGQSSSSTAKLWEHFIKGDKMQKTNKFYAHCIYCRKVNKDSATRGERRMMSAHLSTCSEAPEEARAEGIAISRELKIRRSITGIGRKVKGGPIGGVSLSAVGKRVRRSAPSLHATIGPSGASSATADAIAVATAAAAAVSPTGHESSVGGGGSGGSVGGERVGRVGARSGGSVVRGGEESVGGSGHDAGEGIRNDLHTGGSRGRGGAATAGSGAGTGRMGPSGGGSGGVGSGPSGAGADTGGSASAQYFDPGLGGGMGLGADVVRTGHVTTSDQVRLYYEDAGAGHPLILIHGLSGSCKYFDLNFSDLATSFRVIRFDLRGHGDSDKPAYGFHVHRLAADLRDLLDNFSFDRVALLGCSLGCAVIWGFVELFGVSQISAAMFVDQSPYQMASPDGMWRLGSKTIFSEGSLAHVCAELTKNPRAFHEQNVRAGFTRPPSTLELTTYVNESLKSEVWFTAKLMVNHSYMDWRSVLPLVNCPALVIAGKKSKAFPWEGVAYAARSMPHAKLIPFEEGSHWLYIEESVRFNSTVAAFLQSIVSGT